MTREERKKAIDALKISAPVMAVTQEEFNDYIKTLNKIIDLLEQEPKTGHWIMRHRKVNTINYRTGEDVLTGEIHTVKELIRYECDEPYCAYCGKRAEDISQDYCGYCGARMFEPQEVRNKRWTQEH